MKSNEQAVVPAADKYKFDVFLSYRRSDGTAAARWLRSLLLSYYLPKPLRQEQRRKLNVYLDSVYERATEDFFSQNIEPSLRQSRFLLVISTPNALKPQPDGSPNWVHREVETFSELPQGRNILVALAKGEMDHPLPGNLIDKYPRIEIVDLRELGPARFFWWPRHWKLREEFLKIAAPLHDVTVEEMPLLRMEESRRRQRSLWLTLVSSFALFALMSGLFIWAFLNLASARQQLIRTHLLQGQDLAAESLAFARLHFAEAVRIADSSVVVNLISWAESVGLVNLGLRNDTAFARRWLGQWRHEAVRQVFWHRLGVKSVDFSPDGSRFATTSIDGEAHVWDAASGQPVGKRVSGWPYASLVKFSPDGRRFIVLSTTTFLLQLWNTETGEPVGREMVHDGPVTAASFHPDGHVLATSSGLGRAFFWDAATGERLGDPLKAGDDARLINFSPDGRLFAVVTHGNAVRVWDYVKRRPIGNVVQHKRDVTNYDLIASFHPDSRRLLVAVGDNAVRVHDAMTMEPLGGLLAHSGAITLATYSPDGKRILTSSADGTAQVWDAETGLPASPLLRHSDSVLSASFSTDGKSVVTASRDFTARVWDAATSSPIGDVLQHADFVYAARFNSDGSRVVTASGDGTARLWTTKTSARPVEFGGGEIKSLVFSPDAKRLLTIAEDKTLKVWYWPKLTPAGLTGGAVHDVEEAAFTADGKQVRLRNSRQEFQVWDYDTGQMRPIFDVGGRVTKEANFSADLRRAITRDSENVVRVWDAETGAQFGKPATIKESDVFDASPNGEFLVVLHEDSSLEVLSVAEGKGPGKPFQLEGEWEDLLCRPRSSFRPLKAAGQKND